MTIRRANVLLVNPGEGPGEDLAVLLGERPLAGSDGPELEIDLERTTSLEAGARLATRRHWDAVILDARAGRGGERAVLHLLDGIRQEDDRELRFPLRRLIIVIGSGDDTADDRLAFSLGGQHVGVCLRDRGLRRRLSAARRRRESESLGAALGEAIVRLTLRQRRGLKALNLAGGGITGLYYELGVLKCLDDCLDLDLRDVDLFYGISAGAIAAAGLANGYSIDELLDGLGRPEAGWINRLQLSWRHLNLGEIPKRVLLLQRELLRYLWRMVRREDEFTLASVVGLSAVLLGPIFDNTGFETMLRELFTAPGHSNDFRELGKELYVGATDQDRREHVLFGSDGHDGVPISRAVQASTALHPFFPSVDIDGRRYTDGIVTKTCNLRAAVDRGAELVFVVDPFVPLISDDAGFNSRHGNMWVVEQDLKTMSYSRYEQARNELLRRSQHVSIFTFLPSNRVRKLMSRKNPLVSTGFDEIVCQAYLSTYRRLGQLEPRLSPELEAHGIAFDRTPATEKAERLHRARRPRARMLVDGKRGRQRSSAA